MPWQAWVLIVFLGLNIIIQFYYVDRPRKTKTMGEAVLGSAELCLYIYCVLALVDKIG